VVAAVVLAARGVNGVTNPEEYVNTLGGTDSRYDLSHGNLLPLVNRPWSFNAWAPMTDNSDGSWWFHPTDARFFGIRCTHQVGDVVTCACSQPSSRISTTYDVRSTQYCICSPALGSVTTGTSWSCQALR